MTLFNDPRTRRRRLGVAAAAAGLLSALLTAGPAVATPDPGDSPDASKEVSKSARAEVRDAIESGEIPGQDEIVHSDNIEHLANIPKDALPGTNSDIPFQGKYDSVIDRESAAEILAQKAADAAAAAQVVDEDGVEAQRAQPRRSPSVWERAGKAALGAAATSAGTMVARSLTGRKSRGSPAASAASAAAGALGTAFGGAALGRFARGLLGGLLR